jgi:uncharacterized sulfatase
MQGRAFAGEYQQPPPEFLHGARGRMDERIDLVRSVTDGRYVYLRNYMPHVSQAQFVNYQLQTPTTRVWRELFEAGKTNAAQSIFWQAPKSPEELYDLASDPDCVNNLMKSEGHQDALAKLRKAQREHALKIRDLGFLPEGEIHSRSQGTTPYDMAREGAKYPLERILETAELASSLNLDALSSLASRLKDADSAVRYWAAMGYLMRGRAGVESGKPLLQAALKDDSKYVRVVAAQALAQHGAAEDLPAALATLRELVPSNKNDVFVQVYALNAINALGKKGAPLLDVVRTIGPQEESPDNRYNSYPPRLVEHISTALGAGPVEKATPAKAKGKGKRKAKLGTSG